MRLIDWLLDDQCRTLQLSKLKYSASRYDDINARETMTENAEPFLLKPVKANGCGILLIHGLLASPAEMRSFGKYLMERGFTVFGVRLPGHGTSPYELKEYSWEDWYESVKKQFVILNMLCERSFICGFSTGGALALRLAADQPENIIGVIAVAVPYKFIDPTLMLVPLLHGTNQLIDWVSSFEGVKPFVENIPEHASINYRNAPVRSLYELRRLMQTLDETLTAMHIPALLIFADKDPIVSIDSADLIMEKLTSHKKTLKVIDADRHGILMENLGGTWKEIIDFIDDNCPINE